MFCARERAFTLMKVCWLKRCVIQQVWVVCEIFGILRLFCLQCFVFWVSEKCYFELNQWTKACLPGDGPLLGGSFIAKTQKGYKARATDPVPRRANSNQVWELAMNSLMELITESTIVQELELEKESDQVCAPIPVSVPVGILIEYEGMEWSPAQITKA